jgi:hypothetical protein
MIIKAAARSANDNAFRNLGVQIVELTSKDRSIL